MDAVFPFSFSIEKVIAHGTHAAHSFSAQGTLRDLAFRIGSFIAHKSAATSLNKQCLLLPLLSAVWYPSDRCVG